MARAIWKGTIRFDSVQAPVKLYSGVRDRSIHFHLLHDDDLVRLKQRLVNPTTRKTVPYDQVHRGYEIERNRFVMLSQDELESVIPKASRDIEVTHFVDPSLISHPWYDRPYLLGPDEADDQYVAFAEALQKQNKVGIAHWVMRKTAYVGALRAEDGVLTLVTLHPANEIIASSELEPPEGRALDKRERDLAAKLIDALSEDFDPADYEDDYRSKVLSLIEKKSRGETVYVEEYETPPRRMSLADSLEASLKGRSR